jgi:hypothetical protein
MPTEPDSVPAMLRQVVAMLTDQKREVNRPTCSPELDTVQQAYEAHQWALEQYPALARARDVDVYNFIRSRTDCPFRVAPSIHTHRRHLSAARLYRHGSYRKRVLPTSPRHEASPAAGQEGGAS